MRVTRIAALGGLAFLAACLGDRPRAGSNRRVAIDPDVINFSRKGDQLILAGRVYRGNLLAADTTQFQWRTVDTLVAAVTGDGVLTARGDGVTRVWGVSGTDSAFTVVVVQVPVAPAVVAVTPNRVTFSALTAIASLAVQTTDSLAVDSAATCVSDAPNVASIEGLDVRARGEGTARVRCTIAGVSGVATVAVRQRIVRVRLTSEQLMMVRVGRDSLDLTLARVDSLRQPVARGAPRFVSLDTTIVQVDPVSGTAIGLALGAAKIVGSVEGFTDTAEVRVVDVLPAPALASVTRRGGAAGASSRRPGVRSAATARGGPTATALGARDFQRRDSIFQAGTVSTARLAKWGTRLFGGVLQRHFDDGTGLQDTLLFGRGSGAVFGLEGEATPTSRFRIRFMGLGGKLTKQNPDGESGRVYQVVLDAGVAPFSWLWIQVGGQRRSFNAVGLGLAQWTSLRIGGEARFGMGAGALEGVVRMTYLPYTSTNAATSRPSFGMVSEAGVDYRRRLFNAGIHYGLERLDFPKSGTLRRREQVATLRLRIGLEFGK